MEPLTVLSAVEQVAEHLRRELLRGTLRETMPGVNPLVAELGVGHKTVKAALRMLENEGLLVNQGRGTKRLITLPEDHATPALRVSVLEFLPPDQSDPWIVALRQNLLDNGHNPFFTEKSLTELGMDVRRIARQVERTPADAWVVCSASREVLEWFAQQETPVFSLFGVRGGLPIAGAGPDKASPITEVTRRLIALGHRRISFLCRSQLRLPKPAQGVLAILGELEAAGITTGKFNLPDWEESDEGFKRCLDSLFGGPTPPTALILDEPFLFHAAFHHLARRGLRVPEDISMICTDPDLGFNWCQPSVAHIRWDHRPVVRRIGRWVDNVARGKDDRRQTYTKAEFVDGGTVGGGPKSCGLEVLLLRQWLRRDKWVANSA
ncbi:MAG: substrate-binding domain-containing protein [Akkermansiaceae bacterium]